MAAGSTRDLERFWAQLAAHYLLDEAETLDWEAFLDMALDCNLLIETFYDPALHGRQPAEPGELIYLVVPREA